MTMRIFILILIFIFACTNDNIACRELDWSAQKYAQNSDSVYIGLILSVSIPQPKIKPNDSKPEIEQVLAHAQYSDKTVLIKVIEVLSGIEIEDLDIEVKPYGGGEFRVGEIVVIYEYQNEWHIKNSSDAIAQSRKALTKGSSGLPVK